MTWLNISNGISSGFAIPLLIMTVLFPIIILILLWKLYSRLDDKKVIDRIGSLYEGLRIKSRWALMY
jgi:hypothetical protein